jgi:hypothetical protein
MAEIREEPEGRPGYRSWVDGLRVGVNAEDYRADEGLALDGAVMERAAQIAASRLAGGRLPKETLMLEDILEAQGLKLSNAEIESLRREIGRRRRQRP